MNYLKKVCVFKQICSGYTYNGKNLSGMIKCEMVDLSVTLSLTVSGIAPIKKGTYYLVIGNERKNAIFEIDGGDFTVKTHDGCVDIASPFCAGIVIAQENKVLCYASTPDYKGKSEDLLRFFNKKNLTLLQEEIIAEKEIEKALTPAETLPPYQDDTLATENYYENADVDLKNLSVKEINDIKTDQNETFNQQNFMQEKEESAKIDTCAYDDDNGADCFTALEDVENVLKCFPRYQELERAVYGSVWVSVPLEKGEYYFGKAQIGEEKYLCFAVKGEKENCPQELKELACFIPSAPYQAEQGYFVMFQDAISGKVIKK